MLVLSRRQGQYITVTLPSGEHLTVHVNHIRKGEVRIGIHGPKDVKVDRGEFQLDDALKKLKKELNVNCSDETFIEVWANMPIEALGQKTARQMTATDPQAIGMVIAEIRKSWDKS